MDDDRIAALARSLTLSPTRRRGLGLLAGTACGGLLGLLGIASVDAGNTRKKRRRRRRKKQQRRRKDKDKDNAKNLDLDQSTDQDPGQIQCVPLTPVFDMPPVTCASSSECCGGGTCCTFTEIDGPYTGCYDLLAHTTACGLSCEALVNCLNTGQQCVNGECVDVDPE